MPAVAHRGPEPPDTQVNDPKYLQMTLRTALFSSLAVIGLLASSQIAMAGDVQQTPTIVIAQAGRPPQGGGQGGPQGGPPPEEAIKACASLAEAAACSFSIDGDQISGTCRQPPQGRDNTLLCVPAPAGNG